MRIRPTLLDRAIASIAPGRAAKRLVDRAAFKAMAGVQTEPGRIDRRSTYRSANSDRRQTRKWWPRARSANSDAVGQKETLVARSRDAAMNLPPATAAIERNVDFTIGTGLMAIPDLDGEVLGLTPEEVAAWTRRMMRDYDEYMESTDPDAERGMTGYAQQAVVLRAMLESGDTLGLRCWPDQQIGRVHMTAWKLYEAERIVSPHNHKDGERYGGPNGPEITGGVEVDEYKSAQAFHVLKKPRGPYTTARTPDDTVRFEAWGKETGLPTAVLVFDKRRPEQVRGIPFLAPVLELIKTFSDTTDAAAFSLLLQSMIAVVYKSPEATAMPEPDYGQGELVQADGEPETLGDRTGGREIAIEAGSVLELDSDTDVELKSPGKDNPAYEKFFEAVLTQFGAATGTPFGVLMEKFNESYTASKGELELFYKQIVSRVGRFAPNWCAPHRECWLYEKVARGHYDLPGFLDDPIMRAAWCAVRWSGDGKISLDPLRERKAFEIDEAHGWQTGQQITASINGGDYDANIERRGAEHRKLESEGLPTPNAKGGGVEPNTGGDREQDNGDDDE